MGSGRRSPTAALGKAATAPNAGLAAATALPQPPQNFSSALLTKPHWGQATGSAAPHSAQKRRPSRFSVSQRGQRNSPPARCLSTLQLWTTIVACSRTAAARQLSIHRRKLHGVL